MTRNQTFLGVVVLIASVAAIAAIASVAAIAAVTQRPDRLTLSADFMLRQALQSRGPSEPAIQEGPDDRPYSSTLTLTGSPATLRVWPRDGSAPVDIEGARIEADYYHTGRVLVVETTPASGGAHSWQYFNEPVRWRNGT